MTVDAEKNLGSIIEKNTDYDFRSKRNGRLTEDLLQFAGKHRDGRLSVSSATREQLITLTEDDLAEGIQRIGRVSGLATASTAVTSPLSPQNIRTPPPKNPGALLGSHENPISREQFTMSSGLLRTMQTKRADPSFHYLKVAPTFVLYPRNSEIDGDGNPLPPLARGATNLQTLLQTKTGQTFPEAMSSVHGKCMLMNFCTPSVELYPKKMKDCGMIYDLQQLDKAVVPDESVDELTEYIKRAVEHANPLVPKRASEAKRVAAAMKTSRRDLGRDSVPWRLAFNKSNVTVVAWKLGREEISQLLRTLGRTLPYHGERLFRKETFDDFYQWGEGDWVLMDIDPETDNFKYDKHNFPLVRTVNGASFESTYNTVESVRSRGRLDDDV